MSVWRMWIGGMVFSGLLWACGPSASPVPEPLGDEVFEARVVLRNMTHDVHRFTMMTPADHLTIDCEILMEDPTRIAGRTYLYHRHEGVVMSGQQMALDTDEERPCNMGWLARHPYVEARPDPMLIVWEASMPVHEHRLNVSEDAGTGEAPVIVVKADYIAVSGPVPPFGGRPCENHDETCLDRAARTSPPPETTYTASFHGVQAIAVPWGEDIERRSQSCPEEEIPPGLNFEEFSSAPVHGSPRIEWKVDELRARGQDERCQDILLEAPVELYGPGWFSWRVCLPESFLDPLREEGVAVTFEVLFDSDRRRVGFQVELTRGEDLAGRYYFVRGFELPAPMTLIAEGSPHRQCDGFKLDYDEVGLPAALRVKDGATEVVVEAGELATVGDHEVYVTRAEYRAVVNSMAGSRRTTPGTYFEVVVFHGAP